VGEEYRSEVPILILIFLRVYASIYRVFAGLNLKMGRRATLKLLHAFISLKA
jgi:hypothetical protein